MRLDFIQDMCKRKYLVFNRHGECLGKLFYYPKWKCWVWDQELEIVMSSECLEQIVNKLKKLDNE